ncbi:MAG: hypothetical protein J0M23_03645 [Rickettsiales bacterium]|nr:hypothetical protein [Rickettsiales bacterium]
MKKEGKRMDKKASVAIELQVLDYAIQLGLVLGLLFTLGKAAEAFIISVFGFIFWLFFCLSIRKNNLSPKMEFDGDIDRLTLEMVDKVGLILINQVGNYYIYGSRTRIMRNV